MCHLKPQTLIYNLRSETKVHSEQLRMAEKILRIIG